MGKVIFRGNDYTGGDLTSVSPWLATTSYLTDDIVISNAVVYTAKKPSINQLPSNDSEFWKITSVGDVMNALNRKLSPASDTQLGTVKVDGDTITADADGTIHGVTRVDVATTATTGIVKPDGTSITIDNDGTIHGVNQYELPVATTTLLGGIKPDGVTTTVNENGVLTAAGTLKLKKVDALPTQDISTSTIYLVPKSGAQTSNVYDEYVYVDNSWEKIGDTEVDISGLLEIDGNGSELTLTLTDPVTQTAVTYADTTDDLATQIQNLNNNLTVLETASESAGVWIKSFTLPALKNHTITNSALYSDSIVDIRYSGASVDQVVACQPHYTLSNGSLVISFTTKPVSPIVVEGIHVVNVNHVEPEPSETE